MILSLIILFGELYLSTIIALTPVTDLLYRFLFFFRISSEILSMANMIHYNVSLRSGSNNLIQE